MSYRVGSIEVLQTPCPPCTDPVNPGKTFLRKGHQREPDCRPFAADTILERDIVIPLRDGTKLRANVFRPATASGDDSVEKVPVLIAWSPYGKDASSGILDILPGRMGLPRSKISGYESFEAPDPAEWTAKGYAICNVDVRGVRNSGGDLRYWGTSDGRDGYDAIEYLTQLPWCNGSAALVGNSALAMSQWFIAAEHPPHLKCIAPLEGASDPYREDLARGGVPAEAFNKFISGMIVGPGQRENLNAMLDKYPFLNEYWADKRANMKEIVVPAYVLASFSTGLHTEGSFRGYEEISSSEKWLRVHSTQEWFDLYSDDCTAELSAFFDRYTKGIQNGWEKTPRVRVSIIHFNKPAAVNQAVPEWPLPSTSYQTLYLTKDGALGSDLSVGVSSFSYQSDVPAMQMDSDGEELHFEYTFPESSIIVGYPQATLYLSCDEHDDMDVFVQIRKADKDGKVLKWLNVPQEALGIAPHELPLLNPLFYLGPSGILRASLRATDQDLSKPYRPKPRHINPEPVPRGSVVKLQIAIWPMAMAFERGEKLVLKISGHHMTLVEFPPLRGTFTSSNKGKHTVYTGERYPSAIDLPFVRI